MSRHDLFDQTRPASPDESRYAGDVIEVNVDRLQGRGVIVNDSGLATSDVIDAVGLDHKMLASVMRWSNEVRPTSRHGSLFDRDRFVSPAGTFGKIRVARDAMSDDIVGGAADATESLAFGEREQDRWNQWAGDINLDELLRSWWRTLWTDSQAVLACWWGQKTYRARGTGEAGRPAREQPTVTVPLRISILDTLKVTPVGTLMFGMERLAYIATREEAMRFDEILGLAAEPRRAGEPAPERQRDDIVERLIIGRYDAPLEEKRVLREEGVDPTYLYELDPTSVFRHTLTRGTGWQRFADVRMEGVFASLDQKNLLRQMDRTHLLGGINFIILIKKGSKEKPGTPAEINSLAANAQTLVRLPVMVTDHRVEIEIVKPPLDGILDQEKYRLLNGDIAARLLQTLVLPSSNNDQDPLKLGKLIAEGLESRRRMMKRSFEKHVLALIVERNQAFTSRPKLKYRPSQISLTFDSAWASFVFDARMANELSRDTFLGEFGFDQADEGRQREREAEKWDKIFKTQVPHSTPATPDDPKPTGPGKEAQQRNAGRRQGGRSGGGGGAPGSGQGKPAVNPRKKST